MSTAYDFSARAIDGKEQSLAAYRGKVLLVVNVASKCGFTPQYTGLEALYKRYREQGLEVLGFPCDQFRQQEPGDDAEIANFCSLHYAVTFPMFSKIEVNGRQAHPFYKWLRHERPGVFGTEGIKWNFTKFLVNREGQVLKRYAPSSKPESLGGDIEAALNM
jgi:glutathione peroxidase